MSAAGAGPTDPQAEASAHAPEDPQAVARLRAEVDALDDALLALVARRLALACDLARAKGGRPGTPDSAREAAIIARLTAQGRVPPAAVEQVWGALLTASRAAQAGASRAAQTGASRAAQAGGAAAEIPKPARPG